MILIHMCMLHIEMTCFWQLNIRYWSWNTNGVKLFHPALEKTLVNVPSLQKKPRKTVVLSQLPLGHSLMCHYLRYSFGVEAQHNSWNTLISSRWIPSANGDSHYPPAKAQSISSIAALMAANEHNCYWNLSEISMFLRQTLGSLIHGFPHAASGSTNLDHTPWIVCFDDIWYALLRLFLQWS